MTEDLPNWLYKLARELRTQDNLATHAPIFQVRQKQWYPAHNDMDPHGWITLTEDRTEVLRFVDAFGNAEPEPKGGEVVYPVWQVEPVVQVFLTQAAAESYIAENRHNLRQPFVYVESMYRNKEMTRLREWIMRLENRSK